MLIQIHCVAHRFALCTSQAAQSIDQLQEYKTVLTNLFYYFKSSSVRSAKLQDIQEAFDLDPIKVKEIHDIRWFSFFSVLESVYRSWQALVAYFESCERSKDPKASGLFKQVTQFKFVAFTWCLMDIIPITTHMNLVFQKEDLDISLVRTVIRSGIEQLEELKSDITKGHYHSELTELLQAEGKDKAYLKGQLIVNVSKQEKLVHSCMIEFISNLISNMKDRFPDEDVSVLSAFHVLAMRDISFIPRTDLPKYGEDKLQVLCNHYSPQFIDAAETKKEFRLLVPLVLDQKYPRDKFQVLWQIIAANHHDSFPNLLKLAQVALILPVHTAQCERGFSTQNLIKSAHRNRLQEKSLNELMMISLEGPSVREYNPMPALHEWRTKKNRRIFKNFTM